MRFREVVYRLRRGFDHRGGEVKGGFAAFGGFFDHRGGEVIREVVCRLRRGF